MNKLALFGLLIFILSCSSEIDVPAKQEFEIVIEGTEYSSQSNKANLTANENCDFIFVSMQMSQKDRPIGVDLKLTKKGALVSAHVAEYNPAIPSTLNYHSTYWDPAKYLAVANFSFDEENGKLFFEFQGKVFGSSHSEISIAGHVDVQSVIKTNCTSAFGHLTSTSGFTFLTSGFSSRVSELSSGQRFTYSFQFADGFLAVIDLDQKISEWPVGKHDLSSSDENSIQFKKFVGLPETQPHGQGDEWDSFEVTASLNIVEHKVIYNWPVVVGKLTLNAYQDGILMHRLSEADIQMLILQ